MRRFAAVTAVLATAVLLLAAWSPAPRLAALPQSRLLAAPGGNGSLTFQDMERMEAEALRSSLEWLARRQEADGRWKASGQPGHGFEKLFEPDAAKSCDVMATSLALLAFVGDANTPWRGPYQEVVKRGLGWLLSQVQPNGCMLPAEPEPEGGSLSDREKQARRAHVARLNHMWGTLALIEIFVSADLNDPGVALSDAELQRRRVSVSKEAMAAAKFISRDPSSKEKRFDFLNERTLNMDEFALLGTLWYSGGRLTGSVEGEFWDNALVLLKKVQVGQTEVLAPYRYSEEGEYWFRGMISTPQMMICFVYFGVKGGGAKRQMEAAGPVLLAHPPVWNPYYEIGRPSRHPDQADEPPVSALPADLRRVASAWKDDIANEASWFWQGMAFRSMGGASWNQWRSSFVPVAWDHQRRAGAEAGSWDPVGPHARVFGREVSTAWMALTLQSSCKLQMARTSWSELMKDPRQRAREENLAGAPKTREKCTICGMEVMSDTSFSLGRGPDHYYFCSEEHKEKFEMNSEPYLKENEGKPRPPEEPGEGSEHGK